MRGWGGFVLVLLLAAGARAVCLPAEFWFDEIWSWDFARRATSPLDLFLGEGFHSDNNHKLNTLALYFLPDGLPWWAYRLHSFLAGVGAVALAILVAGPWGRPAGLIAGLLTATDFWLIAASSEARGYALAVLFALLAYRCLERYLERGEWGHLPGYWAACCLGLLSHLTFLHACLALGLWSVLVLARRRTSPGGELRELLKCQGVPALFFVFLYLVDVRHLVVEGGPSRGLGEVVGSLIAVGLGLPWLAWWPVWLALALGVVIGGARYLRGDALKRGAFFVLMIVVAPVVFLARKPEVLFERYLLLPWTFFLLLLAVLLGAAWARGAVARVLVVVALALVVLGNAVEVTGFVREGRGAFPAVLAYLADHDPGPEVVVTSDQDLRTRLFLDFYRRYHPERTWSHRSLKAEGPPAKWLLVHWFDDDPKAGPETAGPYRREAAWPLRNRLGWSWYVYRRERD